MEIWLVPATILLIVYIATMMLIGKKEKQEQESVLQDDYEAYGKGVGFEELGQDAADILLVAAREKKENKDKG